MVSTPVSGLSGLGSDPGQGHFFVVLGQTFYSRSATHHPRCKWVPANLILGVTLLWTSFPSRGGGGSGNTSSLFMLRKPG